MKFFNIWAFVALASTTAAFAEIKTNGWIKGTLNDQEVQWDTIELPGDASTSSWSEFVPGMYSISVQGHVGGAFAIEKSLAITFEVTKDKRVSNVNVVYLPTNSFSDYYEGRIAPDAFTLTGVEFGEEAMQIKGSVSGELVRTEIKSLDRIVDKNDTIHLDVEFMTEAQPEQ